jgi:hypothetical protein
LLEAAGFRVSPADGPVRGADPFAIAGIRSHSDIGS